MRNHKYLTAVLATVAVFVGALAPSAAAARGTATTTSSSSGAGAGTTSGGQRYHVVRPGDSVRSIANAYGVSADSIRSINGIVGDRLYAGARVLLDSPNPGLTASRISASSSSGSSSKGSSSGSSYTVKNGDVLERIARRHGVKLSALLAANGLKVTSLIFEGDVLTIPSGSSKGAGSAGSSSAAPSSSGTSGSSSGSSSGGDTVGPDLVCPVPGASFMNDWGFPRGSSRFHEGTDMFAAKGTTIYAPASGVVSFGSNNLGGTTFTLSTNSGWVIYGAHLSDTIGSSGSVSAGTPIGVVGNSGNAAGGDAHLHLGIKPAGGSAINPYPSLRAACG